MPTILLDMGGVLTDSPFENFAAYEARAGLPPGLVRRVNATDPDTNAWSRLERRELDADGFVAAFEAEAAALGFTVDGLEVLACLDVEIRLPVVAAVRQVQASGIVTALLTNNHEPLDIDDLPDEARGAFEGFATIIESSVVGVRKPQARFYEIACQRLGVEPAECVFLDDLGINLKPAAAMGMTTIKVTTGQQVIGELAGVTGLAL